MGMESPIDLGADDNCPTLLIVYRTHNTFDIHCALANTVDRRISLIHNSTFDAPCQYSVRNMWVRTR